MTAGMQVTLDVFRQIDDPPDLVGGAVLTGSFVGRVEARVNPIRPAMILLAQGIEVYPTFDISIGRLPKVRIRENDQLEISKPEEHPYYGVRLLVQSVTFSSMHPRDSRYTTNVSAARVEDSRGDEV